MDYVAVRRKLRKDKVANPPEKHGQDERKSTPRVLACTRREMARWAMPTAMGSPRSRWSSTANRCGACGRPSGRASAVKDRVTLTSTSRLRSGSPRTFPHAVPELAGQARGGQPAIEVSECPAHMRQSICFQRFANLFATVFFRRIVIDYLGV